MLNQNDSPRLRDFIYLDVERVKSLLAQLDQGVLTDRSHTVGTSGTVGGETSINLPWLAKIGGTGQYVTTNQSVETRTLHDYVYNQTESLLIQAGRLIVLPDDFGTNAILADAVRDKLSPVSYILARGKPQIRDMRVVMDFLPKINELQLAIGRVANSQAYASIANKNERRKALDDIEKLIRPNLLDDQYLQDLTMILDKFYKDRLLIRILPFGDPDIRVVGPLQEQYLRDSVSDIRFKYGSNPQSDWTLFAQIAAIPKADTTSSTADQYFAVELERALEGIFGALTSLEGMLGIGFPEIAVTPIAIYRD